jgi:Cd2+/Zn2+-exporting ATPase
VSGMTLSPESNDTSSAQAEAETSETLTLRIEGMDCSCEAQLLEREFAGLAGVTSYNVDAVSQKAHITYDPSRATTQDIIRSVSATGMTASLAKEQRQRSTWWRERQQLALYGTGILILVAVALRLLGMPPWLYNAVYVVAVIVGVYYPARKALVALINLTPTIHLLMLIGSGGAMILGMWAESAILIFVYSLGDVLESYAVDKARGAIRSLIALMPKEALVRVDGREVLMKTESIQVGDIVIVRPGERVPVDGKVAEGASFVDEATVTGESIPVRKSRGDNVFAGTINQNGSIEVRVDKPASETMLSKIIMSVEEAQAKKTSYQTFSDNFAKYYTPAMFVLGVLVATVPPLFFGQPWHPFILRGLVVFVVSCSCGLALSVPTAVVAAMANAARNGTVFKGGAYLEAIDKVKTIAFDKTGTLTIGRPEVTDVQPFGDVSREDLLRLAGAIESRSGHPLAAAVARKAKEYGALSAVSVEDFQEVSGLGVTATIDGRRYCLGNPRFQQESEVSVVEFQDAVTRLEDAAKTVVLVSENNQVIGLLGIADTVRPGAKDVIERLRRTGIRTVMLTGDNERSARAIASQLGIDEYFGGLLPTDKVDVLKDLREKYGSVAMVGDGINDAPAMAVSNVGIAMGAAGSDVAVEAGDVVLMSDDLAKIGYLRELSARAVRTIRQNIWISLANVAFMVSMALIGLLGLVSGLLLNEASALVVIFNAVWLLKWQSSAQAVPAVAAQDRLPAPPIEETS